MIASKIHILSESLMKRIAAGEVIERPASVLKELLENSIDAGADQIQIIIKGAGSDLIQIVDNGEGMTEEDVKISCERHATSKLSVAADLDAIMTMGFRGEALASISSVSRLTITTKTENDTEGTEVYWEDSEIKNVTKTAFNRGTSIKVQDLFYNVPARRKFMRSPSTELRHLMNGFRRIAMAYSEIQFSVVIDDAKAFELPQTDDPYKRMQDILSQDRTLNMISFEKEMGDFSINGYISRPGSGSKTRNEQFLFLNHRYIVDRTLTHAILSAYGTRLGRDEYASYVIFIQMDPHLFDVNVHPSKMEVRFSNERFLHDILYRTIKDALNTPNVVPELKLIHGKKPEQQFRPQSSQDSTYNQMTLDVQKPIIEESPTENYISYNKEMPVFWQIHNKYILSPIKSGLTIIDQHAAHERILFEKAIDSKIHHENPSQALLFPQTVELSPDDFRILSEILPYLEKIGFSINEFGKNTVVVDAVPVEIKTSEVRELLLEIMDEYQQESHKQEDIWHAVAASFACKAAVKTGDKLSAPEMSALIDQLFSTREPYFCPHGRPVVVNLTLDELDKRFGR